MKSLFNLSLFNPIVLYIFTKPVLKTKHKKKNENKNQKEMPCGSFCKLLLIFNLQLYIVQ